MAGGPQTHPFRPPLWLWLEVGLWAPIVCFSPEPEGAEDALPCVPRLTGPCDSGHLSLAGARCLPFALTVFLSLPPTPCPHPVGYCSRLQEGHSSEVFPGSPLWTRRAFAGIQGWKICVSGTRPRRHGKGNGKPRGKTTGRSGTVREECAAEEEESPLWGPAPACPAAPAIYSRCSRVCLGRWGIIVSSPCLPSILCSCPFLPV